MHPCPETRTLKIHGVSDEIPGGLRGSEIMRPKNKIFTINGAAYILSNNKGTAEARARQHFGGGVTIGSVSKVGTLYKISVRHKRGRRGR